MHIRNSYNLKISLKLKKLNTPILRDNGALEFVNNGTYYDDNWKCLSIDVIWPNKLWDWLNNNQDNLQWITRE